MTEPRRLEYVALEDLLPALRNPKAHDHDALVRSVLEFGFTAPALLDERTVRLTAGHGRVGAVKTLRDLGAAPPDGVLVERAGPLDRPGHARLGVG